MDKCIRAFISGRVQGVFFRDSTRTQAVKLGISGFAKNLSDGRVEVMACGDNIKVDKLIDWLHSGPEFARVDNIIVKEITVEKTSGFYIS